MRGETAGSCRKRFASEGDVMSRIAIITCESEHMLAVYALRHEVFVIEQNVPVELEIDEYDASATHLAAMANREIVGTLRIVALGQLAKIGRMAVSAGFRRKGIARQLMRVAEAIACNQGH